MNLPFILFCKENSYKIWLCQFNLVDDIIHMIKKLLYQHAIQRVIKAPTSKEIKTKFVNRKYINPQGIVYHITMISPCEKYKLIKTIITQSNKNIMFNYFNLSCSITVDMEKSHIQNILIEGESSGHILDMKFYNQVLITAF